MHDAVINSSIFIIYKNGKSMTNTGCDITYNILVFSKAIF